jgi:SPP1 gp7 family putative phage head morphogenesis protein
MIVGLGHIEDIFERAVLRSIPSTVAACTTLRRFIASSRDLEAARAGLPRLRLPLGVFEKVCSEELLVAHLFGRLEVEAQNGGLALYAPSPRLEFSKASADEAVSWFARQRILRQKDLTVIQRKVKARATGLTKDLRAYIGERLDASLSRAIQNGTTKANYLRTVYREFDAIGVTRPKKHHVETIFDTVGQAAYSHGRFEQQRTPAMMKARPFWQYKTAGDSRVRPAHAEMANRIYPADNSIWDAWYPPNGFRCRCAVISITSDQVQGRGGLSDAIGADLKPDAGFEMSPGAWLL